MAGILQFSAKGVSRRRTASQWSTENLVLRNGEIGVEGDTQKLKAGDGVSAWNDLPYIAGSAGGGGTAGATGPTGPAASKTVNVVNKSSAFTLTLAELDNSMLVFNSSSAVALTVPADSSFSSTPDVGSIVAIMQLGTGVVSVTGGAGVTIVTSGSLILRAQYSSASLTKIAANTWYIAGDTSV